MQEKITKNMIRYITAIIEDNDSGSIGIGTPLVKPFLYFAILPKKESKFYPVGQVVSIGFYQSVDKFFLVNFGEISNKVPNRLAFFT